MKRMYGVYYRKSAFQPWQFYVGSDAHEATVNDAKSYAAAHPSEDVIVAAYADGYPHNWHRITNEIQRGCVDRRDLPIGAHVGRLIDNFKPGNDAR